MAIPAASIAGAQTRPLHADTFSDARSSATTAATAAGEPLEDGYASEDVSTSEKDPDHDTCPNCGARVESAISGPGEELREARSRVFYLAIPPAQYIVASVDVPGQSEWIDRFRAVESRCKPRLLSEGKELPRWLRGRQDYSIWQRNNLWMLQNALVKGGAHTTVIALWDGGAGDGPGGTQHRVGAARRRGVRTIVLDARELFVNG